MNTPTVLLILEEPQDLEIYGSSLREAGYDTLLCTSAGEGINSLESESVSLVVVGQDTPGFEGRLVLERSIELHPDVPVLVLARVLDMDYYFEAVDLGAISYLERPEPQELVWVVAMQMCGCGSFALLSLRLHTDGCTRRH